MHFTMDVGIKTLQESLFESLEMEGKLKQWLPRLDRMTYEELPENGEWKGTTFTLHFRPGRKQRMIEGEIIAYRKPDLFGVRLYLPQTYLDVFFSLEEKQEETQLSCDCEVSMAVGGNALKTRLIAWKARRSLAVYLKNLKNIMEAQAASA
ncbi:hypothetical protein [Melghirimyces algeriensis]|uniref:Polyketide cyclase / dehydrase and lipid transport n=1 Tax=Melghirimyces algeriensis TaxID=910412 RepID=A0A521D1M2_9BACL|nr:hypothetical protein [Melghirimyces algeriensis]SMO65593.1 hypothetical protein SAMN06264849_10559 [Melghirimyces algeriensis]